MSDHLRIAAGCFLILAALTILFAGILPFPEPARSIMHPKKTQDASLTDVPHLDTSDIFNSGSRDELMNLPGIGESISSLILEEREANGPFFYAEDILSVRGIGPVKLEALRSYILNESGESGE